MTRQDQAARAATLRAEGLLYREIGERMGISTGYAHDLVTDPEGMKVAARKQSYRGACDTCGGPTTGSNGRGRAPTRCLACQTWTREAVVEAFLDWFDEHDHPPRTADVSGGRLPHTTAVKRLFGSWTEALLAAGLPVLMDRRESTLEDWKRRALAGEAVADIAAEYGVTPSAIWLRLRNHGTSLRAIKEAS